MLPTETKPPLALPVVEPLVEACWLVVESGAWLVNLLRVSISFGISFFLFTKAFFATLFDVVKGQGPA